MSKVLIVHHVKPYHLDDFLAVSLLLYKYSRLGCQVERLEVKSDSEVENVVRELSGKYEKVIVVDVGKRLGTRGNVVFYDHHQSINIPCSFILVLKHELPEVYSKAMSVEPIRRFIEYVDVRDRFGEKKADEMFEIVEPFPLFRFLTSVLMTEPSEVVGENFVRIVEAYLKTLETSEVYDIDDVRVVVNRGDPREVPISVIADIYSPDLIIQRNVRDSSAISVVKNQYSAKYSRINLAKLREKYEITFIHANGFLAVVKIPIEKVCREVVREIVSTVFS